MDAHAVLTRLLREHTKSFIRAARCFPPDKLDFRAAPGNRTPLDMLQEVATISQDTPKIVADRKMSWSPEDFARQKARQAELTDLDEILARVEASTETVCSLVEATDPGEFDDPVDIPWPGDFRVLDVLTYHLWNLNYHEGQLVYVLMALGLPTPFDGPEE